MTELNLNETLATTIQDTVTRMDLLESRVSSLEESVTRAVGDLMPKVDALLSERNQEGSTSGSSPAPILAASPASVLELAERGDGDTLFQWLADERVDIWNNPPRTENGDTALHVAASGGHVKAVIALLGAGAKRNASGHRMCTPLHCAATHGHLAVSKLLLNAGAKVDVKDRDGATALTLAAGKGHMEVVRLLLEKGAQINKELAFSAVSESNKVLIELYLQKGGSVDACNEEGETLLVQAAKGKRWGIVELLLEKGACVSKCKVNKECALVCASQAGRTDAVRLLLARGAASISEQLELAIGAAKNAAMVWTFVDFMPNIVDTFPGGFGLVSAGGKGCLESLVALLEAGVDINAKCSSKQTALNLAAANGRLACVKELLRRSADVNAKDKNGNTPLHRASFYGQMDCVRALLAAGAVASEKNNEGKTPLQVASTEEIRRLFNR